MLKSYILENNYSSKCLVVFDQQFQNKNNIAQTNQ